MHTFLDYRQPIHASNKDYLLGNLYMFWFNYYLSIKAFVLLKKPFCHGINFTAYVRSAPWCQPARDDMKRAG
jgi:hypothetical protein